MKNILTVFLTIMFMAMNLSGCAFSADSQQESILDKSDEVQSDMVSGDNSTEQETNENISQEPEENYTDASYFEYHFQNGKAIITGYTGSSTEVKIPKVIEGYEVCEVVSFSGNQIVESVIIPEGVTALGSSAFCNCVNLTNIVIPDSVISIREDAFAGTRWLDNQPEGVVYAGKVAYTYKTGYPETITEIELEEGTLGIAERAFSGLRNLERIDIPDSVFSVGAGAFDFTIWYDNQKHTTQTGSSIVYDNGESMKLIYVGKVAYELLVVSVYDSVEVTLEEGTTGIAESCFSGSHLESIYIPESVVCIGRAAFQGTDLMSVTIPENVFAIGGAAFYNCKILTHVTIPDNVVSIGVEAFDKCEYVTIYGNAGSYAETYAEESGIAFDVID